MKTALQTHENDTKGARTLLANLAVKRRVGTCPQPVTVGIPFARGHVRAVNELGVTASTGKPLPSQWKALDEWSDGSVKWGLLDVVLPTQEIDGIEVVKIDDGAWASTDFEVLRASATSLDLDIQPWKYSLSKSVWGIQVGPGNTESRGIAQISCALTARDGEVHLPVVENCAIETSGPVRTTVVERGRYGRAGRDPLCEFETRVSFFPGTGVVRIDFTLRNPHAARHPGGLWDLGDEGSFLFRSLGVSVDPIDRAPARFVLKPEIDSSATYETADSCAIYQASSGGSNWHCRNHVNRAGEVVLPFQGYKIAIHSQEIAGLRASPVATLSAGDWAVSAVVSHFWEQFPKRIRFDGRALHMDLFPELDGDLHELQGGEQKTHTVYLQFDSAAMRSPASQLTWAHHPVSLVADPAYSVKTGAFGRLALASQDPLSGIRELIVGAGSGPHSFFSKREAIDEYGWRNFGDVYADHENQYFKGDGPVISHYNNQYDLILGLLTEFARSSDDRFFDLADDLARHVIDIDIYHTKEDRPIYSGGLFWHTDHYVDAHRSTHRTYSRFSPCAKSGMSYGGGPSNEHNYTSGLLLYHYMTGCPNARKSVIGLAEWVLAIDHWEHIALGALVPCYTGCASSTHSSNYHGPGRGAGNSINACLDAFRLTNETRFLEKAEQLIRRCVHPKDDQDALDLLNAEARWSYLVFLQVLGKYLDLKRELGQRDLAYSYARSSLVAYAKWMLRNEVPYFQVLDRVEYPTETWSAHDLRKSVVLDYAAWYGPPEEREAFLDKARFFYAEALKGLERFESRGQSRPVALVLQNAPFRAAFEAAAWDPEPAMDVSQDFGEPTQFEPQRAKFKRLLSSPLGWLRLASIAFAPRRIAQLVRCIRARRLV